MSQTPRKQGILLHPTSLPGPEGIGTLGDEAYRFLSWLQECGARAWQFLPIVPIGAGYSPYSSTSAFAGNPLLISLAPLKAQGWITEEELASYYTMAGHLGLDQVRYAEVIPQKRTLLERAAERYLSSESPDALETFCQTHHAWLEDAALFEVISRQVLSPWWEWPVTLRQREPRALEHARQRFKPLIDQYCVIQMWFQDQWESLRAEATRLDIELIGDVPIYVDHNSADVWSHPQLFEMDDSGTPHAVAGVPPDAFSETGQLWGSPLYRWEAHAAEGYTWWRRRLTRILSLTHTARIDHFRAFADYWSIPFGSPDAREGKWMRGPGNALFEALSDLLNAPSELEVLSPLIAEDLGLIDEPVRALLAETDLPGMKVLQFAFNGDPRQEYLPHNYQTARCVVYTGTHDNQTTRGWWESLSEELQDQVRRYCSCAGDPREISWDLIKLALASVASLAVIPLQDLLALSDDARMNQPSIPEGNWAWRVRVDALNQEMSHRLYELNQRYARLKLDKADTL